MPKRKNPRKMDMTNEEIERYVFPKKVREAIQDIAQQNETEKSEPKPRQRNSSRE